MATLTQHIASINATLSHAFKTTERISDEEARNIIRRYVAVFYPNFLVWFGQGLITARSAEAKFAFTENLEVEIQDKRGNHQTMLYNLASSVRALPTPEDFEVMHPFIQNIRDTIKDLNGVKLTALAAILESTSLVFIPYLEILTKQLGGTDFTYTKAHGEADIMHADQFTNAYAAEIKKGYIAPDKDCEHIVVLVEQLLTAIFQRASAKKMAA